MGLYRVQHIVSMNSSCSEKLVLEESNWENGNHLWSAGRGTGHMIPGVHKRGLNSRPYSVLREVG